MEENFSFYDLKTRQLVSFNKMFPEWSTEEHIVVFSPHDDDSILGVGYAIIACQQMGATVDVVVFHDGCAGYSDADEATTIVEIRKIETRNALAAIGIDEEHIHRYEIPDFSSMNYLYWKGPGRTENDSIFEKSLRLLCHLNCIGYFSLMDIMNILIIVPPVYQDGSMGCKHVIQF